MEENKKTKGRICVLVGTGFLGSWIVKRQPQELISLLLKKVWLKISVCENRKTDLDNPESFVAAIEGCDGVFHTAHPPDFEEKESEETKIKRVISGTLGILQACIDSKTVKRVVYTSSISAAVFSGSEPIDENCWTEVDIIRSLGAYGGPYIVTKTLAEKAALEFVESHGLDLVSVLPTWITSTFICPNVPDTVHVYCLDFR